METTGTRFSTDTEIKLGWLNTYLRAYSQYEGIDKELYNFSGRSGR